MTLPSAGHEPVMLDEVMLHLAPQPGEVMVDCTLGRGGHSAAIAQRLGPTGTLIGLDADPRNLDFARTVLQSAACTVRLFHANFAELAEVLKAAEVPAVHGVLADLGVSTNQLMGESYGMTFANDVDLDMRLDPRIRRSAADFVNTLKESDLANLLFELAQERYSRRIARKIVDARRVSPITTTGRLAGIVRSAIPSRGGAQNKIDPATRSFMALRMAVNDEMGVLGKLLETAPTRLKPSGRLAVISFQSMEDRLVKQAFRSAEQTGHLNLPFTKPLTPTEAEQARNPRSRSAKLRVGVAPA